MAEWICDHCDTAMPGFYQRCRDFSGNLQGLDDYFLSSFVRKDSIQLNDVGRPHIAEDEENLLGFCRMNCPFPK